MFYITINIHITSESFLLAHRQKEREKNQNQKVLDSKKYNNPIMQNINFR